jgi:hypothetical protein
MCFGHILWFHRELRPETRRARNNAERRDNRKSRDDDED